MFCSKSASFALNLSQLFREHLFFAFRLAQKTDSFNRHFQNQIKFRLFLFVSGKKLFK
jgi:hypothetical protein